MINRPNYVNAGVIIHFRKCTLSLDGITCTRTYPGSSGEYADKDIENDFPGVAYIKSSGLFDVGEKKNVYTEEYADSNMLRYHQGGSLSFKNTNVTIDFIVTGADRASTCKNFLGYLSKSSVTISSVTNSNLITEFWDTKRTFHAFLILKDAVQSEEVFTGGEPYIKLTLKFTNVFGRCFKETEITNNQFNIQ